MIHEELKQALRDGRLWDFLAEEYHNATKYELKEIILAILGVVYDHCGRGTASSDEDYLAFQKLIEEELHERSFFDEDWEDDDDEKTR